MTDNKMNVHKVTLSSGKEVLLRELKIKDQELAAQAAASRTDSTNEVVVSLAIQRELIKMLVVQVNGESVKPRDMENLDNFLTFAEYTQLQKVIVSLTGVGKESGNFQVEMLSSGDI